VKNYLAYIQYNAEEKWYQGFVPGIPGAEATARSMQELKENLRRAVSRCMRERRKAKEVAAPRARYPGYRRINVRV